MIGKSSVSRRGFMGGMAGALGALGVNPAHLFADDPAEEAIFQQLAQAQQAQADYDKLAKIANNENPWGPSDAVIKVMNSVWKYSNRYGYPDANVTQVIADHHGVKRENLLLGAGSGEILRVVGLTYDLPGKKVVGVEPSYATVFQHASGLRADAFQLPLKADYTQDIDAMIETTKRNYRDVAFVYMCNPNNPTGVVVTKDEIRALVDGIPEDIPILIDEAYHHFVDDPRYETALPYVLEGRNVIIARTFSKIYGFAGLRLGYAIAPKPIIDRMSQYSTGSTNALVKWGVVAALSDPGEEQRVKRETLRIRNKTTDELKALGYEVIPSQANFFMVGIKRPVQPVIAAFREKGVLVGRPFPPMTEHLRVSVGLDTEMERFMTAFKQIFPAQAVTSSGS